MFTGLIEKIGTLTELKSRGGRTVLTINHEPWDISLSEGESVSVQGACFTVCRYESDNFSCDVLDETLSKTNLETKRVGSLLNLERALRAGAAFGGHFVTGHVDAVGKVVSVSTNGKDRILTIQSSEEILTGIVLKGSIACDGVSLTVTDVTDQRFSVGIIPFTWEHTTLGNLRSGDTVNLETDVLGKYVQRFLSTGGKKSALTMDDLEQAGFV